MEIKSGSVGAVIEALKNKVAADKTARDVFHVMSLRERARNIVTLGGLDQRMKKEGFNYEKDDYVTVLKFMASLGFGKLELDSKGRVTALKDIKTTLQSIGEVAMGLNTELHPWKQRNKFRVLSSPSLKPVPKPTQEVLAPVIPVSLTVVINGKAVNVALPNNLNERDVADLVMRFREKSI